MTGASQPSVHVRDDLLSAGAAALVTGDWEHGRACFEDAIAIEETPEALEGLALAAWWLDDAPVVFASRERAYRLYRDGGDQLGAARIAIWLGLDYYLYRGEMAIANGWFQRADRLLADRVATFEHGWLVLMKGHVALFEQHDVVAARQAGIDAGAIAETIDSTDLRMLALALEGLALVSAGRVREGMPRLDEATAAAVAGDISDPDIIVTTCCYLIYACERVRDIERAAQWCTRVEALAQRWSYRSMFAFCRTHYATVLLWHGDWPDAERQLLMARGEFMATRPGWVGESILRLGQLRLRQGQLEAASTLFVEVATYPAALLGQAEIALARNDTATAADLVERFLRRVPEDDRTERAAGLELGVRIHATQGTTERAQPLLADLEETARLVGTSPLAGAASLARARLSASIGDYAGARLAFEDAIDAFERGATPFEAARARLELAAILTKSGRTQTALHEASAALAVFTQLGAARDSERALAFLHAIPASAFESAAPRTDPAGLTRRESEVLALVARGLSNQQIAEQLFLSIRTVERHISTIYDKIGAKGSSARTIATVYALRCGLSALSDP